MSQNIACCLRTQRRAWELSQEELASLVCPGDRQRVSSVEQGRAQPNAREILAYPLIFGVKAAELFPLFAAGVVDELTQRLDRFQETVADQRSPRAGRKRELLEEARKRVLQTLDDRPV